MKKIITICTIFILFLWATMFLASCRPVREVNVLSRHNYYQKHRFNTYTSPIWIPGRGVILETHIYRLPKRSYSPRTKRGSN